MVERVAGGEKAVRVGEIEARWFAYQPPVAIAESARALRL